MRPIACAALALLVVAAPGTARAIDPAELAELVRLSDGPPPRDALFEGDLHLAEAAASDFDLPVSLRPPVVAWMRYFLGGGRLFFERWLLRLAKQGPAMRATLRDAGLPADLAFVALVESGLNDDAVSRTGATGRWQFSADTARLSGLAVSPGRDERLDGPLSTRAAARHLAALHRAFGDWELALAAYNGGVRHVREAIARGGSRDFWALAAAGHLSTEAANYVPKIQAAAILARHADRFGLPATTDERNRPESKRSTQ